MIGPTMRLSSIRFATDAQGHLCVELPRAAYGVLAVVLAAAAGLMVTRWGVGVQRGLEAPPWVWWGAMAVFVAFAAVLAVQARWGHALVFDAHRGAVMRGERVVARYADVSHVELIERRGTERHRHWVLRVHRTGGRPVFIGRESDKDEADRAGARLATAVGKSVKVVVR